MTADAVEQPKGCPNAVCSCALGALPVCPYYRHSVEQPTVPEEAIEGGNPMSDDQEPVTRVDSSTPEGRLLEAIGMDRWYEFPGDDD